jgi:hypothetical protein
MLELTCWILCGFGLFEIMCGLANDNDWSFVKGFCLVFAGLMFGIALKCMATL